MTTFDQMKDDELIEQVRQFREDGGQINLYPEPPIHLYGCDDLHGRFNWYQVVSPPGKGAVKGVHVGIFHTPKDMIL